MKNLFYICCLILAMQSCTSHKTGTTTSKKQDHKPELFKTDEVLDVSSIYEVATWRNFTKAAISHTWDDNTANQLTVALPIYDAFDFNTTFYIVTNWGPNWQQLKAAYQNGHEIASHSLTHNRFDNINKTQIEEELRDSQTEINSKIDSSACLTFAYSNCISENYNLTNKYYIAARDCDGQIEASTPSDFMKISSFLCGDASNNITADHFNAIAKNAVSQKGWAVYLFHGIDDDGGFSPVTSKALTEHLHFLKSNQDLYWVDTFVNISKYIKERDAVVINNVSVNKDLFVAKITDTLQDTIYNIPLSLRKEIPMSWDTIQVMQNDNQVNFKIEKMEAKKYVVFEAIPDRGIIKIQKI